MYWLDLYQYLKVKLTPFFTLPKWLSSFDLRKWQPFPAFLPGKLHGQRSLAGCSPWGRKESDTTEQLNTCICMYVFSFEMCIFLFPSHHLMTSELSYERTSLLILWVNGLPFSTLNSGWWHVRDQSCLTLCNLMDYSPPDSSVHGILQAKMHAFFQGTFPTRGLSLNLLCLLHWKLVLYHWHHQSIFNCSL